MTVQAARSRPSQDLLRPRLDRAEALLNAVVRERVARSRSDVLREGEVPTAAHVLLDDHPYRCRLLKDGRRQITALLVPGDVCDLDAVMRGQADDSVGALTNCVLGEIPTERVADPEKVGPEMTRALWRRLLRDGAISREWLVDIGRRDALGRVAHLLCVLRIRTEGIGLTKGAEFESRFTPWVLADVLGLSGVHTDRVLQQLRRTALIHLSGGTLPVRDVPVLEMVAGFDPAHLRLT